MTQLLALFGLGAGISAIAIIVIFWIIFWKGWALWIAARSGQVWWFLAILIVNTFGILEIIYIFAIKKMQFNFATRKFEERKDLPEEKSDATLEVEKEEKIVEEVKNQPVKEVTYESVKEEVKVLETDLKKLEQNHHEHHDHNSENPSRN